MFKFREYYFREDDIVPCFDHAYWTQWYDVTSRVVSLRRDYRSSNTSAELKAKDESLSITVLVRSIGRVARATTSRDGYLLALA